MQRQAFIWQEMEHWTGRDLCETIQLISAEDEAASFMESYTAACDDEDHATQNVRYMIDTMISDQDEKERVAELFMVEIPAEDEPLIQPRQWWTNSSCGVKA